MESNLERSINYGAITVLGAITSLTLYKIMRNGSVVVSEPRKAILYTEAALVTGITIYGVVQSIRTIKDITD